MYKYVCIYEYVYINMYICIYLIYTYSLHLIPSVCFSNKSDMESYLVSFGPKDQAMVQVWCHGSSGVSEIADGQGASISAKAWPRVMENIPINNKEPQETSLSKCNFTTSSIYIYEIINRGICTIGCCSGKRPQGNPGVVVFSLANYLVVIWQSTLLESRSDCCIPRKCGIPGRLLLLPSLKLT